MTQVPQRNATQRMNSMRCDRVNTLSLFAVFYCCVKHTELADKLNALRRGIQCERTLTINTATHDIQSV